MQLFIASQKLSVIHQIEDASQPTFANSVSLNSYQNDDDGSSYAISYQLEASALVVVDCEDFPRDAFDDPYKALISAWILGVCFVVGTPVIGLSSPRNPNPERLFTPLLDVVTIAKSVDDLQDKMRRLGVAISLGMEKYAEIATELHTQFLEE